MKADNEIISKVLALYDTEDLVFINLNREKSEKKEKVDKLKIKTLGGKNDRPRK